MVRIRINNVYTKQFFWTSLEKSYIFSFLFTFISTLVFIYIYIYIYHFFYIFFQRRYIFLIYLIFRLQFRMDILLLILASLLFIFFFLKISRTLTSFGGGTDGKKGVQVVVRANEKAQVRAHMCFLLISVDYVSLCRSSCCLHSSRYIFAGPTFLLGLGFPSFSILLLFSLFFLP